jgi:hypothetical protein
VVDVQQVADKTSNLKLEGRSRKEEADGHWFAERRRRETTLELIRR